ncbi:MAG: hypothetical protein HZA31_12000 [Opitutae bacterium]|nr:hypothetical protein [Opitutae bacterium]
MTLSIHFAACTRRRAGARLWLALLLGCALANLVAAYTGPVPAPTDRFGATGPYTVSTATFPCPSWAGHDVTVFFPVGAPGKRPTWFLAHGFAGSDPAYYEPILRHLASHGTVTVFSPYPANLLRVLENYGIIFDGFAAAAERFSDRIDTSRVGFIGHSYGGGAVPALALRALRERNWGGQGLALMLLAPWYSYAVSDADLAAFPAGTLALVQVYEDDLMNDHRMAIDVFTRLNVPAADKDFLFVRSDRIDGYNYSANHRVPTSENTPGGGIFDALDAWAVLRLAQALSAATFQQDAEARAVALGHGAASQVQMGATASGRALRPMAQSEAPVPLFPSSRYTQRFDQALNPRRDKSLPAPASQPHLANLSVRARSGDGADTLIAGAVVAGSRPKSLLLRAVGPGLQNLGVAKLMTNPQLAAYLLAATDLAIDDWNQSPDLDALAAASAETGAFKLADNSKDAAILASFAPGVLTTHVSATDRAAGVALLELYDADQDASSWLCNLSARARLAAGDDVLIAGFVTSGAGNLRLLIRGVGPGLAGLGLSDTLADPQVEIYRDGAQIATNDNWSVDPAQAAALTSASAQVGAFPLAAGSKDAGLLLSLPAGAYTAHIRSRDGRGGLGLVEIYVVP